MENRNGRRVHLSFSDHAVKVTLAWFEPSTNTDRGFKVIELHYGGKAELDAVDKALDILVTGWSRVYVSEFSNAVVSNELDKDPDLFDQITLSATPETFFLSTETLNYCGGKSASMRLWDIEFAEKYAGMIEFNRQALAAK